jgi:hypothetical protein
MEGKKVRKKISFSEGNIQVKAVFSDKNRRIRHRHTYFNMQELKAINEKVKELGWEK